MTHTKDYDPNSPAYIASLASAGARAQTGTEWTGDPAIVRHLAEHGALAEADRMFDAIEAGENLGPYVSGDRLGDRPMTAPPALDWTKEQVAEPTETHERCRRCKGRGWYFGSHFHAGGSPGVYRPSFACQIVSDRVRFDT